MSAYLLNGVEIIAANGEIATMISKVVCCRGVRKRLYVGRVKGQDNVNFIKLYKLFGWNDLCEMSSGMFVSKRSVSSEP